MGPRIKQRTGPSQLGNGARKPRLPRDERVRLVLDAAEGLFYSRGVHEVGMDELIASSGLGKATVYRLFATKDDLIGAYLQRASDRILDQIDATIARYPRQPRKAIVAIFDAIKADAARDAFRGCAFNNASIEFSDPTHPARRVARRHREELRQRLRSLAADLQGKPATLLGDELALVIDGIYTSAAHLGPRGPAASSKRLVETLLETPDV